MRLLSVLGTIVGIIALGCAALFLIAALFASFSFLFWSWLGLLFL